MSKFSDLLQQKAKEGIILISTFEGALYHKINEIIEQPTEGLLYDLNRDFGTISTYIEDNPKWINDYAASQVIVALKNKIEILENELKSIKEKQNND
jgi:hypothetical protein